MRLHFTIRDLLWLTLTLTMSTVGSGFGPGALDFNYALTGGYRLYRNSSHQIMIAPKGGWTADTPIVRPKVVEVAWDDRFILAKRQVLKFRDEFSGDKYELPDPGKFDYWILDTNEDRKSTR